MQAGWLLEQLTNRSGRFVIELDATSENEGSDKEPQEQHIAREPQAQRYTRPTIQRQDQQERTNNGRQCKDHRMHKIDHKVHQRRRRLHLLLRDAARKIIVKERHRLFERVTVQARQDQG